MNTASGHTVVEVDLQTERRMKDSSKMFARYGLKKVVPGDFYCTGQFPLKIDTLYNFALRPHDVFVCSYPKVGSTWLTEVLWAINNNTDLDHPLQGEDSAAKGHFIDCETSYPVEEIPMVVVKSLQPGQTFFELLNKLPDNRVFHSHIPFNMLPKGTMDKAKCVYVIRDPRDVCLSYYHFMCNRKAASYVQSMDAFVDIFVDGKVFAGHYIDHLRQWWTHRNNQNVCTVYYEDVKRNPKSEINRLAKFVGLQLTEQQIKNVVHYTSMAEMKKRDITATNEKAKREFLVSDDVSSVFRKGEIGASKTEMTAEMNEKIAKYFRDNLGEVKLPYDFTK